MDSLIATFGGGKKVDGSGLGWHNQGEGMEVWRNITAVFRAIDWFSEKQDTIFLFTL